MNARPAIQYSENQLQASCHDLMCRFRLPGVIWHHSPNEEVRGNAVFHQKRMGMVTGFPDWAIWKPMEPWPKPFMLEFKKPGGTMSEDQWAVRRVSEEIGIEYGVCRTVDRFIELMNEWELLMPGVTP